MCHNADCSNGNILQSQWSDQIDVLNQFFQESKIAFKLNGIIECSCDEIIQWQSCSKNSSDNCASFAETHAPAQASPNDLMVYTGPFSTNLLGRASNIGGINEYPYVLLNSESLPGGSATDYNMGHTLAHEIGHVLGLLVRPSPYLYHPSRVALIILELHIIITS